jgi:hypothetical protein
VVARRRKPTTYPLDRQDSNFFPVGGALIVERDNTDMPNTSTEGGNVSLRLVYHLFQRRYDLKVLKDGLGIEIDLV